VPAAPDAAPQAAAHTTPHVVGTLPRRAATRTDAWPSRVCVDGTELVFENDCGCNDKLLCQLDATTTTLRVTLKLDPKQMKMCDDCFPMIPARCALPPAHTGPSKVEINGQLAFVLDRSAADFDGSCWTIK
jgi:hypothetical protein